jgi:uncharacterized protein YecE (DUF72 family)
MMASQERFQELFAAFAQQLPGEYLYGLETRNANYLNKAYFEFLNQNGLIPVFLQGYWMPSVVSVYEQWRELVLQQEQVVIRLHGPDREGIEARTGKQWDRIVEPRDEELAAIAETVKDLIDQGVSIYLNVNNHYEGSAPLTIDRIRQLLGEEPIHRGYTQASFDLSSL